MRIKTGVTDVSLIGVAVMFVLAGCQKPSHHNATAESPPVCFKPDTVDVWLVETLRDLTTEQAVLCEHTLCPYHFVEYGATLNELGRQNLDILIRHYREYPGPLSIRRGDVPASLYRARVRAVRDALHAGGVDVRQVPISDSLPGGEGLGGDRVARIMASPMQPGAPEQPISIGNLNIERGAKLLGGNAMIRVAPGYLTSCAALVLVWLAGCAHPKPQPSIHYAGDKTVTNDAWQTRCRQTAYTQDALRHGPRPRCGAPRPGGC